MELSPVEKLERHNKVIRRFKAVVRLVIANLYWIGDLGKTKLSDNVKRNIKLLLRKKPVKTALTIREKSLLSKPQNQRTEAEKTHLAKAISALKCFRKYPPDVKEKLAGITYYVYFGPDREIVRQDQEAQAMYFILSGECRVSVSHFEESLNEMVEDQFSFIKPGSMFGEVALIHGTKRLATVRTSTNCELLMIKKDDFNLILKTTILQSWINVQELIEGLPYFDIWNDYTKRECSIIARMKTFTPEETMLGDERGFDKYTYFIISGTCYIIEQLNVKFIINQGIEHYELIKDDDDDDINDDVLSMRCFKKHQHVNADTASMSSKVSRSTKRSISSKATTISDISLEPKIPKKPLGVTTSRWSQGSQKTICSTATQRARFGDDTDSMFTTSSSTLIGSSSPKGPESFYVPKIRIETHFIKICEFPSGACFNIGEKYIRKRVVALTPVTCLLIPRDFVLRNNIGNFFDSVQLFVNNNIPNTQKVFKRFVENEKFKKYRKQLVSDILKDRKVITNNSINNVPYTIRLREGIDTEYFYLND